MSRLSKALWVLAALVLLSAVLTGCTRDKPTIYVYSWGDYIDESILEEFEKETGIKVVYDTYATNEDMYVKIKAGGSSYDVMRPAPKSVKSAEARRPSPAVFTR